MKLILILIALTILSACSSYRLVDTSDCENVLGEIKKCREVK